MDGTNQNQMESDFIEAVKNNNSSEVQRLLNEGADVNARYMCLLGPKTGSCTAIFLAVLKGFLDIVRILINHNANLNLLYYYRKVILPLCYYSSCERSVLSLAVTEQNIDLIKLLIEHGANPSLTNSKGESPLHEAVDLHARLDIVRLLLDYGAEPNLTDAYGNSPLHNAVQLCKVDIANLLLDRGANPNIQNIYGESPLHIAVCEDLVRVLLDRGANPNLINFNGNSALHKGLFNMNTYKVSQLIKHGADPNLKNHSGHSAIHIATYSLYENEGMVKILLEAGADPSATDHKGRTPLHLTRCPDIALCLVEKGAPIDGQDNNGCTPLLLSILPRHEKKKIEALLFLGAKVDIPDNKGQTFIKVIENHIESDIGITLSKFSMLNIREDITRNFKITNARTDILNDELEKIKKTNIEGMCLYNVLKRSFKDSSIFYISKFRQIIQEHVSKKTFPQFYLLIRMSVIEAERRYFMIEFLPEVFSLKVSSVLALNIPVEVGRLIITELEYQDMKNLKTALQ